MDEIIEEKAQTDSGFAIAYALLRVADAIGFVGKQMQDQTFTEVCNSLNRIAGEVASLNEYSNLT